MVAWIALTVVATLVLATGVNPVTVTEYAVIFAALAMPLTYAPVLLAANDRTYMGRHANGRFANLAGAIYLVVIAATAVAAIPLLVITGAGNG